MTDSDYIEFVVDREFWPRGYNFPPYEHDDPEGAARNYADQLRSTGVRARVHKLRGNRWRVLRHVGWEQGIRNDLLRQIHGALSTIIDFEFAENKVIFSVGDFYVQFSCDDNFYGEAVGATYLSCHSDLLEGLPERLAQLSWDSEPTANGNHGRIWATTPEVPVGDIASLVIDTLIVGYRVSIEQQSEGLQINLFEV